jgi:hypothetical protein
MESAADAGLVAGLDAALDAGLDTGLDAGLDTGLLVAVPVEEQPATASTETADRAIRIRRTGTSQSVRCRGPLFGAPTIAVDTTWSCTRGSPEERGVTCLR